MSTPVRTVFGLPLYNGEDHLREALESLLIQSREDFAVVMADDGSTDRTVEIAREYEALDPRVIYTGNERRLGMVANWRHTYDLARERFPDAEYFAWGSDHDVWHPRWLETLVGRLDSSPEAVIAYPLNNSISETGEVLREPWHFDTAGVTSPWQRLKLACNGMAAGSMVYALYRADHLGACGVYRTVIVPDRLLMSELSMRGQFIQVPEILWHRRYKNEVQASVARQRATFFPETRAPLYMHAPWSVMHVGALISALVLHGQGRPVVSRGRGVAVTLRYATLALPFQMRRWWRKRTAPMRKRFALARKRTLKRLRLARHRARKVVRNGLDRLDLRRGTGTEGA